MSTHKPQRQLRPIRKAARHEDGNHHLVVTVAVLTAILGALTIYAFISRKATPTPQTNTMVGITPPPNERITSDTPSGRQSFVGTIKELGAGRAVVQTQITRNGRTTDVLMTVTILPQTDIATLGQLPLGTTTNPDEAQQYIRPRTPATAADLKTGILVEVFTDAIIDSQTDVTATKIDIYPST